MVDGDVDDGADDVAKAGNVGALVDAARELVLRVDVDDDDFADVAFVKLPVEQAFGVDFRGVKKAAQAGVVGEAAVEEVDVGAFGAVFVEAQVADEFAPCLALQAAVVLLQAGLQGRGQAVAAVAAVVVEGERREDDGDGAGGGDGSATRSCERSRHMRSKYSCVNSRRLPMDMSVAEMTAKGPLRCCARSPKVVLPNRVFSSCSCRRSPRPYSAEARRGMLAAEKSWRVIWRWKFCLRKRFSNCGMASLPCRE